MKIKFNLDSNNPEQLQALANFALALKASVLPVANPATSEESPVKKEKPAKKISAEKVAKVKKKTATLQEERPTPEIEETNTSGIKIEALREVASVALKAGHQNEVKTKLAELGAENISSLDESKYGELHAFLTSL